MDYSSRLGCLLYLDDAVGDKCLCEPSLLFILGLEAVTTPQSEYLKEIFVVDPVSGNYIVDQETDSWATTFVTDEDRLNSIVIHKDRVGGVFNNIVTYMQFCNIGNITSLSDDEVVFECSNLKSFMNEKTGTCTDRICPVILHEHNEEINLEPLDKDDIYNSLTARITDIFNHAGYDVSDREVLFLGKGLETDKTILAAIDEYNSDLFTAHKQMKADRRLFKLLDYKAMYSYALGVLYGCSCLETTDNSMWRTDPILWYNGEYSNLVKTAYEIFKFHYKHPIQKIDMDPKLFAKYKGIQLNKIWNFDNSEVEIKPDEKNCKILYIEDDELVEKPIVYSKSTGPQRPIPGSYLSDGEWVPLDSEVVCDDPKKGIIHNCDQLIVRYIANNEVVLSSAYKYSKGKYLSPDNENTYFCYTDNMGWVPFSEKLWRDYSIENPVLTFVPLGFDKIPSDAIQLARCIDDGSIVAYYESYVSDVNKKLGVDRRSLFGVIHTENGVPVYENDTLFDNVFSDEHFKSHYVFPITTDGCTLTDYYDLDKLISIYVYDDDPTCMWDGSGEHIPIVNFGYTLTPSTQIDVFVDSDDICPEKFDLRYNSDEQYGYWSNTWDPKEWVKELDANGLYESIDLTTLYINEEPVLCETPIYTKYMGDDDTMYIFNSQINPYLAPFNHGFILLDDLYNDAGITTYSCIIIYEDDMGNSLLDEDGNPLVWYDHQTDLYWNGIRGVNRWQSEKPLLFNAEVYDASLDSFIMVCANDDTEEIIIDDVTMSYDDFYNIGSPDYKYGFVKETLMIFKSDVGVIDCYHDTNTSYDRYTIVGLGKWVDRETISSLGYRFVDGISELYNGDDLQPIIYDNDATD